MTPRHTGRGLKSGLGPGPFEGKLGPWGDSQSALVAGWLPLPECGDNVSMGWLLPLPFGQDSGSASGSGYGYDYDYGFFFGFSRDNCIVVGATAVPTVPAVSSLAVVAMPVICANEPLKGVEPPLRRERRLSYPIDGSEKKNV